ncbi:lipopolysaccharide biosynthesis protein [Streptomyces sp. NPDC002144]|uniref:lipopolysaccharide biosynthesis protein n=1 Tax=Streptomyces sp. NPDC006668 TaxID=3156903 RepID=UPI0033ED6B62
MSSGLGRRLRGADGAAGPQSKDQLLRNGHVLTFNSVLTAALGAGYWAFAARNYDADTVGRNYSAVSAMMLLAGVGQLNLTNVLLRFVPTAAGRTRRLVTRAYLAACATTVLLAGAFLLLQPVLSPGLHFLHDPLLGPCFVLASAAYAVFVIQDGVLTGLRRTDWVVLENAVFSVVKIVLVGVLAVVLPSSGILLSWTLAIAVAVTLTNGFLYARAFPRHAMTALDERADVSRPTSGYIMADYVAALFWLGATALLPVLVLNRLGPDQAAYFSLAWLAGFSLYQLNASMGESLIVEAANDPAQLLKQCHKVLRHTGMLLVASTAVLCLAAPLLLRVFGPDYARNGSGLLRLVALSAIPNLVVIVAVSACRAQRRLHMLMGLLAVVCSLSTGLSLVLLPVLGIAGVGAGWLIAQTFVALLLWWQKPLWLPVGRSAPQAAQDRDAA